MGKATIVSGGTDGKYMVKMDYGKAAQTANLARITKRQTELVGLVAAALQDLNLEMIIESLSLEAVENAIRDYVDAAADASATQQALADAEFANSTIASSVTATPAEKAAAAAAVVAAKTAAQNAAESFKKVPGAHAAALAKLVAAKAKTAKLQLVWQILKDEQTQLQKDQDYWAGLRLEETKEAWCADFSEDAKGVVEIMEIPGEDLNVLIGPQDEDHKLTNVGALTAREVQTPEQVFFNAAILPGWQKFKPMYRRGVVTKVDEDGDTVDVTFDDDKSSAQKLDINRYKKLAGIPVKYMACNAGVFEVGDHCVVKFTDQNWSFPVVVGFVDNPKPCGGGLYFSWKSHANNPPGFAVRQRWQKYAKAEKPADYTKFKAADRVVGYYTWSSSKIRAKSFEIQLSWGFANSNRYEMPQGSDLWMDGVAVTLVGGQSHQFILAACIVKETGVGYFVRTCRASGLGLSGSTFDVVDYGMPSGVAFDGTARLKAATSMTEINRYTMSPLPVGYAELYADEGEAERWLPVSRPCFNESGSHLAFTALVIDPAGKRDEYDQQSTGEAIAVVSIPSMTMTRQYIGGQSYTATQTVSGSYDSFSHVNEDSSNTGESSTTALIAVDYLGDELVWAYKRVQRSSVTAGTLNYQGNFSRSTTGMHSVTYHVTAGHSKHGEIVDFNFTVSANWTTNISMEITGNFSRSGSMRYMDIGFIGDLSRDCFAFGWTTEEFTSTPVFSQVGERSGNAYFSASGVTINPVRLDYSVYVNGVNLGKVFSGMPIFSGPTSDGTTPPPSQVEQVSDDSWRIKDGAVTAAVSAVGIGALPEYNYSQTHSGSRLVSLSSSYPGIGGTFWGVHGLGLWSSPDLTGRTVPGLGFYDFSYLPAWHSAASQSHKTAYFAELTAPDDDYGVCHVVREGGGVVKMDFSGTVPGSGSVDYLLTPQNPIIFDAPIPTP